MGIVNIVNKVLGGFNGVYEELGTAAHAEAQPPATQQAETGDGAAKR